MHVLLTDEAKSDLAAISAKLKEKTLKKISYLADFPYMGPKMEDTFKAFRCLLAAEGKYRVIYKVVEEKVIVYYIRHVSRQLGLRLVR